MAKLSTNLRSLLRHGDLWLITGLFGSVLLLILPVAPAFLDCLLALSIALSLLTLLIILYVRQSSDFTSFPTLLLFLTLFRLSLNVASTRLILLDGYAGHVIESFGNFVVRGNYVVGLVVFLILVLINFIVITKGAGRIAEVAARFTLDAMPGKQMSIDAELNAGVINETEARTRRKAVEQEADFYGAMDGASKFVRGDAIAAILITLINIVGGFAIGIAQKGMTVTEALQRFTILSIGDGLVSQIPALITSIAAGILVTRAASKNDLGQELARQLMVYPRAMTVLSVMMSIFALVPGLPMLPFLVLAVLTGLLAYTLHRHGPLEPALAEAGAPGAAKGAPGKGGAGAESPGAGEAKGLDKLEELLRLDPFQVELGYGLVSLADKRRGGDLLDRVTSVRRTFAQDIGVIVPPIRLRDNLQLGPNEYRFLLKGNPVAQGELRPGYWLAMNAARSKVVLKGVPTVEPVFQLPGANTSGTGPGGVITDTRNGADFFNHLIALQNHLLAGNTAAISSQDAPALAKDEENITSQITHNGLIQSHLSTADSVAAAQSQALKQTISQDSDADLAQTLTQLSATQTAYQAALQSGAKLLSSNQTLLNYLQ